MFIPIAPGADRRFTGGWTLNYEFLLPVFALCLAARREVTVARVGIALVVLAAAGGVWPALPGALAVWADPIVLEFVLGMMLAVAYRRGVCVPVWAAAPMLIAALGLILAYNEWGTVLLPRWLGFGLTAALVVAAFALMERDVAIGWIDRVGDASYASICATRWSSPRRDAVAEGYIDPAAMPWTYLGGVTAAIGVALLRRPAGRSALPGWARRPLAALAAPRELSRADR